MMLGLTDTDCTAAGMRFGDLRSAADRDRAGRNLDANAPARSRGFGAARRGIGTLVARLGPRPRVAPETSEAVAAPPAALGSTR